MAEGDPKNDVMETRAQPDPFVREGRSSGAWVWVIVAVVVAAVAVTFVVTNKNPQTAQNQAAPNTPLPTGASSKPPHTALPTGRTGSYSAPAPATTGSHSR